MGSTGVRSPEDSSRESNDGKQTLIDKPGRHDVLLGRGGGTNNHSGNVKFREIVNQHKMKYISCSKAQKPKVAQEVVKIWMELDPPGRFLQRVESEEKEDSDPLTKWQEVPIKKAREKASQCLRERSGDPVLKKFHEEIKRQNQQLINDSDRKSMRRNSMIPFTSETPKEIKIFHRRGSLPLDVSTNAQNQQAFMRRSSTSNVAGVKDDERKSEDVDFNNLFFRQQQALLRENTKVKGVDHLQMSLHEQARIHLMQQRLAIAQQTQMIQQSILAQQLMMENNNLQLPSPIPSTGGIPSPGSSPSQVRQSLPNNFSQMSLSNSFPVQSNQHIHVHDNLQNLGDMPSAVHHPYPDIPKSQGEVEKGQVKHAKDDNCDDNDNRDGSNISQPVKDESRNDVAHALTTEYETALKDDSHELNYEAHSIESIGDSIWHEGLNDSGHEPLKRSEFRGRRLVRGMERSFSHMSTGTGNSSFTGLSDMDLSAGLSMRDQKMSAARSLASNQSMMSELTDYEDI